jgi:uncharacterized protein YqiB (DUF1249 family)
VSLLHDLYSSPNIRVIKSRMMIEVWHVAQIRRTRNAYKILNGKSTWREKTIQGMQVGG